MPAQLTQQLIGKYAAESGLILLVTSENGKMYAQAMANSKRGIKGSGIMYSDPIITLLVNNLLIVGK